MTEHKLALIPQLIADGWQGECVCGWHTFVSFYEIPTRDQIIAEIERRYAQHVEVQS